MRQAAHAQRGQAFVEFSISVTLLLSTVLFSLAIARYGLLNERTQSVLRYPSLIAQNQDPYGKESLASTYEALGNEITTLTDGSLVCSKADTDSLSGKGPYVNTPSSIFWLPQGSVSASCSAKTTTFSGAAVSGSDLSGVVDTYTIQGDASGYSDWLTITKDNKQSRPVAATTVGYRAPSVASLLQCYSALGTIVHDSVFPPAKGPSDIAAPPLMNGAITIYVIEPGTCTAIGATTGPTPPAAPIYPPTAVPAPAKTSSTPTPNPHTSTSQPTSAPTAPGVPNGNPTPPPSGNGGTDGNNGSKEPTPPPHTSTPAPKAPPIGSESGFQL